MVHPKILCSISIVFKIENLSNDSNDEKRRANKTTYFWFVLDTNKSISIYFDVNSIVDNVHWNGDITPEIWQIHKTGANDNCFYWNWRFNFAHLKFIVIFIQCTEYNWFTSLLYFDLIFNFVFLLLLFFE